MIKAPPPVPSALPPIQLAVLSCLLLTGVALAAQPAAQPSLAPLPQRVQAILQARFPASGDPPTLVTATGSFRSAPDLSCFYDRRKYAPAWLGEKGVRPDADELIAAL